MAVEVDRPCFAFYRLNGEWVQVRVVAIIAPTRKPLMYWTFLPDGQARDVGAEELRFEVPPRAFTPHPDAPPETQP